MTSSLHLAGVCRAIVDVNLSISGRDADALLAEYELVRGVHFVSDEVLEEVSRSATDKYTAIARLTAGGPVSNSLFAIANNLGSVPRPFRLSWVGLTPQGGANLANDPLASLRKAGVEIVAVETSRSVFFRSLCLVDRTRGDKISILVGDRDPWPPQTVFPQYITGLIVQASDTDLLISSDLDPGMIAVVMADASQMADKGAAAQESLKRVVRERRGVMILGQIAEFRSLGLLDGSGVPVPWIRSAELVATNGPEPVWFWSPELKSSFKLPASGNIGRGGPILGAGDAYAGIYFAERMRGRSQEEAHAHAVQEVRRTGYSRDARAEYSLNLTQLFGDQIDRKSNSDDWWLFDRVRESAGLTVISCNNTGVDNSALRIAEGLGLANFAVMPTGCRRDDSPSAADIGMQGVHVLELGTSSYRYCTWANVYLADGTLLLDISHGEGSAETRRAARTLSRPLLEIDIGMELSQVAKRVVDWITQNAIRVVNVAGSRAVGVSAEDHLTVDKALKVALQAAGAVFGTRLSESDARRLVDFRSSSVPRGVIGLAALEEVSSATREVLFGADAEALAPMEKLIWQHQGWTFIRGKSLDLACAVSRGVLSLALVGGDVVAEVGGLETIAEVGLFNCLVAEVEPEGLLGIPSCIVTQYPRISSEIYRGSEVEVIKVLGSAEGWVAAGLADGAIDTWRTGHTANRHGLRLQKEVFRTSLSLVSGPAEVPSGSLALGWELVLGLQGKREFPLFSQRSGSARSG